MPVAKPTYTKRTYGFLLSNIAACTLLIGQGVQAAGIAWPALGASIPLPSADAFYKSPSDAELNSAKPGQVLRYREMTPKAYYFASQSSKGWQIMYRTTDHKGRAVSAVTAALVPSKAPFTGRKLFVFNAAYDALTLRCAPSYMTAKGTNYEQIFVQAGLNKGWVTLLPDYEGLNSYWALGKANGRATLDAVRAAESFTPLRLSGKDTPVGMIGYSGGSVPATWANELYKAYAPEINIVGIAAGGIPVDLGNVARAVDGTTFAGLYLGVVTSQSRAYPELNIRSYLNETGLAAVGEIGEMCAGGFLTGAPDILTKFSKRKMSEFTIVPDFLQAPGIPAIIEENRLGQQVPGAPMYLYNGTKDEVMPYQDVVALKDQYCSQGAKVQLKPINNGSHITTLIGGWTGALTFIEDRFNGKVNSNNCL